MATSGGLARRKLRRLHPQHRKCGSGIACNLNLPINVARVRFLRFCLLYPWKPTLLAHPLTSVVDPKQKSASEPCISAYRPKQKYTAARGRTGVGHDRDLNLGATLQPLRSRQLVEQHLRFLQIGGVEPLGEPAEYWGKQIAGSSNEGAARAAAAGADSWGRRRAATASRWSSLSSSEPKHGVCSAAPPPSGALIAYSR